MYQGMIWQYFEKVKTILSVENVQTHVYHLLDISSNSKTWEGYMLHLNIELFLFYITHSILFAPSEA